MSTRTLILPSVGLFGWYSTLITIQLLYKLWDYSGSIIFFFLVFRSHQTQTYLNIKENLKTPLSKRTSGVGSYRGYPCRHGYGAVNGEV